MLNLPQARALAKKKWGVLAFAKISRYGGADHLVGKREFYTLGGKTKSLDAYYGQGKTWEEAFERAESKGY
jgi:hypothetical protein